MPELKPWSVAVIGGGAAGFFAALAGADANPAARLTIFERTAQVLAKVKISGGGRCNVTHACFDPEILAQFYPRGGQELRGPFSRFQPRDTIEWFESRGIALKTEVDGRVFPVTDSSQTIIDGLVRETQRYRVGVQCGVELNYIRRRASGDGFVLCLESGETIEADRVILATGSGAQGWEWARFLGHTIEPPVPSLFTFTLADARLEGLSGVSVADAELQIDGTPLRQRGPLLITHVGLSGPAILKLSAWGARSLHGAGYRAALRVNWLPRISSEKVFQQLTALRATQLQKVAPGKNRWGLPDRLWARLSRAAGLRDGAHWTEVSREKLRALQQELQNGVFQITGKSPFKEEFVTCGGIRLDEVDFRTMESKKVPGLYFAGEVLDIDAVTGGFNFQNAWTTGWIAGRSAVGGG